MPEWLDAYAGWDKLPRDKPRTPKVDHLPTYRRTASLFFALSDPKKLTPAQRRKAYRAAMGEAFHPDTRHPKMWLEAAQRML